MASPDFPDHTEIPTEELIPLILHGQTELYEEIIRRYQREVLQVVGSLLYDRQATEDLVQEVFVNAYFALAQFQPPGPFGPWIRTIARNAVRQELRKQARYDRRLRTYAEMLTARLSEDERAADEGSRHEVLQRCIARLPERQATAIRLRYSEGMSIDRVAAVLGITSGGARNLLCEARKALRQWTHREMNR